MGSVAVQRPLQRVRGLGRALVVLLIVSIPLQMIGIASNLAAVASAKDFLDGVITEDDFVDATTRNVGALANVLMAPIAILTIIWMFRIATNLRTIGRSQLVWAPGWAIGGWFAPPCLYVIPWLMIKELWRASDSAVPAHDPRWKEQPASPLITVWWVLFGLIPLLNVVSGVSMLSDLPRLVDEEQTATVTAENLVDGAPIAVIVAVASIAASIVYLLIVRSLTARHAACTGEQ